MRRPMLTQYNVEFPSDPGTDAKLTRLLIQGKADFQSIVATRVGDKTMIQFLAPKSEELRAGLKKMRISVREEMIFELRVPHHHDELHRLAATLAEKDINILSLYSAVDGELMRIVLAVDQPANAAALMRKLGYEPEQSVYD